MHIIRDQKMIKTMKLYGWGYLVFLLILIGLDIWLVLTGTHPVILVPTALLLVLLFFGWLFFRSRLVSNYSVDAAGIRALSGRKVIKTAPWHEFVYVGELNVSTRDPKTPTQRLIVCLPEPPKPALGKGGDCHSFSQKGAIWMDYTPEDAQIMRPYYRGSVGIESGAWG